MSLLNNDNVKLEKVGSKSFASYNKVKPPKNKDEVIKLIKSKKVPIPRHDKVVLYMFDSDALEDIKEYNSNFLFSKSDNKKVKVGMLGNREVKEEMKWDKGVIVAMGKGFQQEDGSFQDMQYELYDVVALGHFAGTEITYDGVDYCVCRTFDIICKLPE